MGKTKIATIDDSQPQEEVKKAKPKKINPNPEELEAAKAQLSGLSSKSSESSSSGNLTTGQLKSENRQQKTDNRNSKQHSKKYQEALEKVERIKKYSINEAVEMVKTVSYTKFDGTIEAHLNTSQKNLRGLVTLPFSAGKKLTVLAFGDGALDSGADIVGTEETLDEILKGKVNFDVLITTPAWMSKLAKAARVLGPRGLMPNPKNGTITDNLKKAVAEVQAGKTEYKTEKAANVIHLGIGKVSQKPEETVQNVKVLISTIGKTRVKKMTLAPTMGPGVKVDLASI